MEPSVIKPAAMVAGFIERPGIIFAPVATAGELLLTSGTITIPLSCMLSLVRFRISGWCDCCMVAGSCKNHAGA